MDIFSWVLYFIRVKCQLVFSHSLYSLCPTLTSLASLTETSEESKEMLEIATSDDSFYDEENMIENLTNKNSRRRLDTLTVEKEKNWMTSGESIIHHL